MTAEGVLFLEEVLQRCKSARMALSLAAKGEPLPTEDVAEVLRELTEAVSRLGVVVGNGMMYHRLAPEATEWNENDIRDPDQLMGELLVAWRNSDA